MCDKNRGRNWNVLLNHQTYPCSTLSKTLRRLPEYGWPCNKRITVLQTFRCDLKMSAHRCKMKTNYKSNHCQLFDYCRLVIWTFQWKLKTKKTKTQEQKTQKSRAKKQKLKDFLKTLKILENLCILFTNFHSKGTFLGQSFSRFAIFPNNCWKT